MTAPTAPPAPIPELVADPGSVRACGEHLLSASGQLDDLGGFAAGPARLTGWRGLSGAAYADDVRGIGRAADDASLALRAVALRVLAHADALDELLARRRRLDHRRDELLRQHTWLGARLPEVGDAAWLERRVRELADDVATWLADVDLEERAMVRAFETGDAPATGHIDPADGAAAPTPGASVAAVAHWWRGLTRVEQEAVVAADPDVVGALDGLPPWARELANVVALDRDLAVLGLLAQLGRLGRRQRQLLGHARAADRARTRVHGELYLYDPDAFGGDGAVAVVTGDLDDAGDVAVLVPGFGTDADDVVGLADRADHVATAAQAVAPAGQAAVIAWIGYDAPDNLPGDHPGDLDAVGVVGEGAATDGGGRLADLVDGLRSGHEGPRQHLTVIGHSYGSTTVGHAAHDHGLAADEIVVVGSPGLGDGVDHAGDLGIDPRHVWVGADSHDPVATLGDDGVLGGGTLGGAGLGRDPAEDSFGGIRFQAESVHRGPGYSLADHSRYFDHDTESLHNLGEIVTGHPDAVTHAGGVHDPWWRPPQDPERGRTPTAPDTDGHP